MPDVRLPILLLASLTAPVAAGAIEPQQRQQPPAPPQVRRSVTEVTIQSRMIIRVPRMPGGRSAMPSAAMPVAPLPPIRWVERKSDKCVPVEDLAAATITSSDSVDLVLAGGKRMRARLDDDCPALDFYSGFYVRPSNDGKLCADRDSIRSRSGGECRIASFTSLVPSR